MPPLDRREWTLMFYFASDNGLAPQVVSQLKAIKQAGFHNDANVIAQFDPNAPNADTHIFDINRIDKLTATEPKIGFIGFTASDPFVVNIMTDKVWRHGDEEGIVREQVMASLPALPAGVKFDPPEPPPRPVPKRGVKGSNETDPKKSLEDFLDFCVKNYPARHYMLFILGHGLVVGNDTFLLDENATTQSLGLRDLGMVLADFKGKIKAEYAEAEFELVSFHSCSMSSLEVAFELDGGALDSKDERRGTANYMLAAQGPSFVGSWPYRQILIRMFKDLERKRKGEPVESVRELLKDIFSYCLYNSYDYVVAGYNFDVCLCDLNKIPVTQGPLSVLSAELRNGLGDPWVRERILLAHWDAQSYWLENYTDLHDFCICVQERLRERLNLPAGAETLPPEGIPAMMESLPAGGPERIWLACKMMTAALGRGDNLPVVSSRFAGAMSQYARGLSVFFPWSRPTKPEFWPEEYEQYRFTTDTKKFGGTPWSEFLEAYFDATRRNPRHNGNDDEKRHAMIEGKSERPKIQDVLLARFSTSMLQMSGQLAKGSPVDSQGDSCDCPSVKNYPQFIDTPPLTAEKEGGTS